jgi:hypothetical protein
MRCLDDRDDRGETRASLTAPALSANGRGEIRASLNAPALSALPAVAKFARVFRSAVLWAGARRSR